MAVNIGLGYTAQLVNGVLQWRVVGATTWTTIDSPVTEAKFRLDSAGTIVRIHYIGPWSYIGGTGPSGGALSSSGNTISPSFAAARTGTASDWVSAPSTTNIPAESVATTSAATYFEGTVDLTSHQIINVAPSTSSTGVVIQQQLTDAIAIVQSAGTPIEVAIVNNVVTSAIGVLLSGVTIDTSNAMHTQITINLGTTTNGKRRKTQGFRLMSNGSERDLIRTENRIGEAYTFVFLRTVDGSNSVNLLLN